MTGFGRGKLILCGEHAVVYGHPALAAAIDLGVRVDLTPHDGPTHAPGADTRLTAALRVALPERGWRVSITSDLPVGRGMGSSAALSVALVRAAAAIEGHRPTAAEVYDRAFAIERVFHGNPSGLDHAVSDRGGLIRYRRGPPAELSSLPPPSWSFVVLDSGTAGDTKALVAGVASRRPAIDEDLDAIGALVADAEAALHDVERLGPILDRNHALLAAIGVSTPKLDALAAALREAGAAGAKLAGAGGGGVVLGITDDPDGVRGRLAQRGIVALTCRPAPTRETP